MMRGLRQLGFRLIGWGWFLWDADPLRARTPERLVPRLTARAGPVRSSYCTMGTTSIRQPTDDTRLRWSNG